MTPHDLLANFEVLANAPNGIQRLRELVLELAVRGKLVEQDPGDEPAQRILERAKACKSKLPVPGRQGRSSPAVAIETPFDLPHGWSWARMEDICDIKSGVTKGRNLQGIECQEYPYIRVANVQAGYTDLDVMKTIPLPVVELDAYRLVEGDVLLTEGGDWDKLGRSAVWAGEIDPCIHQNHVFRARCLDQKIRPRWISSFTNSPDGRAFFQSCSKQTTNLASINMTQLKSCLVPMPPSAEQDRILARVDELMALLDRLEAKRQDREAARTAARDSALAALREAPTPEDVETAWLRIQERFHELFHRQETLPSLRQVILHLAIKGVLLPQDAQDEDAGEILKSIRSEASKSKAQTANVIPSGECETSFPLPTTWKCMTAGELCRPGSTITYGVLKPVWVRAGIPTVRVQDMQGGEIFLDAVGQCSPERAEKFSKTKLETGDLLIAKDGATLGKTAFVPSSLEGGNITQHVLRFPINRNVLSSFIRLVVDSPHGQAWMKAETKGVALPGVNVGDFRRMPVPIPPLAEQQRIVKKINHFTTMISRLSDELRRVDEVQTSFAAASAHHLEF